MISDNIIGHKYYISKKIKVVGCRSLAAVSLLASSTVFFFFSGFIKTTFSWVFGPLDELGPHLLGLALFIAK